MLFKINPPENMRMETRLFWGDKALSTIINTKELALFCSNKFSELYKGDGIVLKLCKPQSKPKDIIRKYVGSSQGQREMNGSRILRSLGIKTPAAHGTAFSINPIGNIESIYAMECIENALPLSELTDGELQLYHKLVVNDLKKMISAKLIFKDLRFHNIIFTQPKEIVWIDTDTKLITDPCLFETTFAKTLKRLLAAASPETQTFFAKQLNKI